MSANTSTPSKKAYVANTVVLNGTVALTSSHELPAVPKKGNVKAKPARTMGIIGLITTDGEYIEVTDFSNAWKSMTMDQQVRIIADKQERKKDEREVTYHNLVRAVPVPAPAPAAPAAS